MTNDDTCIKFSSTSVQALDESSWIIIVCSIAIGSPITINKRLYSIKINTITSSIMSGNNGSMRYSSYVDEDTGVITVFNILRIVTISVYIVIFVLGVGGNFAACYIISRRPKHNITTIFLINLSVADLMMAIFCVPVTLITDCLLLRWVFGTIMCHVFPFVQGLSVFLGALTHVAISLDRYFVVFHPLRRQNFPLIRAIVVLCILWIFSIAISSPMAFVAHFTTNGAINNNSFVADINTKGTINNNSFVADINTKGSINNNSFVGNITTTTTKETVNNHSYCQESWKHPMLADLYSYIVLVFQYILPLVVIILSYSAISVHMWFHHLPGESIRARDEALIVSKRKMIKMFILVAVFYSLSQLPRHIIFMISFPHDMDRSYIVLIMNAAHLLSMSACFYNPLLYIWLNAAFRRKFWFLLTCHNAHSNSGTVDRAFTFQDNPLKVRRLLSVSCNNMATSTKSVNRRI